MDEINPLFVYIDDNQMNCIIMEIMMVKQMGFSGLAIFEDTENIMARLEALPDLPTVIFTDIQIEPYNGFELLQMLRVHPRFAGVKCVAVTASAELEPIKMAGFDGMITKPISNVSFPKQLLRLLNGERVWE